MRDEKRDSNFFVLKKSTVQSVDSLIISWLGMRDSALRAPACSKQASVRVLAPPNPRLRSFAAIVGPSPTLRTNIKDIYLRICLLYWLGRRDSNPRMLVPETSALPLGDAPIAVCACALHDDQEIIP